MAKLRLNRSVRGVTLVGCALLIFVGVGALRASEGRSSVAACELAWRVSPGPRLSGNSHLNGVAVVSPDDVWAVGVHAGIGALGGPTLTEHWNGKQWRVVPSPSVGKSELFAVSAVGPGNVWAVGIQRAVTAKISDGEEVRSGRALVEHWNGSAWKIVPIASPPGSVLKGVAALSARDVWVVGAFGHPENFTQRTFLAHWNGRSWRRAFRAEAAAQGRNGGRALEDVVALSPGDVWAVGEYKPVELGPPLIMHWNGKSWRVTPARVTLKGATGGDPGPGPGLQSVSAVSPTDIWAVGTRGTGSDQIFIFEHWYGRRWREVPGASQVNTMGDITFLFAVAAAATDDVWAVGTCCANEHWDGSGWTKDEPPTPLLPQDPSLHDVAAVERNDFWAVGVQKTHDLDKGGQALIEHYGCA
jgi:hypothetical protein